MAFEFKLIKYNIEMLKNSLTFLFSKSWSWQRFSLIKKKDFITIKRIGRSKRIYSSCRHKYIKKGLLPFIRGVLSNFLYQQEMTICRYNFDNFCSNIIEGCSIQLQIIQRWMHRLSLFNFSNKFHDHFLIFEFQKITARNLLDTEWIQTLLAYCHCTLFHLEYSISYTGDFVVYTYEKNLTQSI